MQVAVASARRLRELTRPLIVTVPCGDREAVCHREVEQWE
jgi:hypothetical protein